LQQLKLVFTHLTPSSEYNSGIPSALREGVELLEVAGCWRNIKIHHLRTSL